MFTLKLAHRRLARSPAVAPLSVAVLGLCTGASVLTYNVGSHFVLESLPYADPLAIASVWGESSPGERFSVSGPTFDAWLRETKTLSGLGAFATTTAVVTRGHESSLLRACAVSSTVLPVLGRRPLIGRGFHREEETTPEDGVALLSHRLWERLWRSDPDVVGRALMIDGEPVRIIGVMPADFYFPDDYTDFWRPLKTAPHRRDGPRVSIPYFHVIARLKHGVTEDQATSEFRTILAATVHRSRATVTQQPVVRSLWHERVRRLGGVFSILMMTSGALLVIGIANLSILVLARQSARIEQCQIALAMGASRLRLFREETLVGLLIGLYAAAAFGSIWLGLHAVLRLTTMVADGRATAACPLGLARPSGYVRRAGLTETSSRSGSGATVSTLGRNKRSWPFSSHWQRA